MDLKHARQMAAYLRSEIAQLHRQRSQIGAAAIAAKRSLTDTERQEFVALGERITIAEGQAAEHAVVLRDVEARNESERHVEAVPDPDALVGLQAAARGGVRVDQPFVGSAIARPRGRRFADLFGAQSLTTDGFANAEDFFKTLHLGRADARLRPSHGMRALGTTGTEAVPSDGGFLVPTQIFADLFDQSLEDQIVLPLADVRPMTSSEAKAPAWDDVDHSANIYGGFTASWIGETAAPDPQMGKLRMIQLKSRKLALFAQSSNELVADGVSFENQLGKAISTALGFFLDQAFLRGEGSNRPLGVFNSGALISVARTTSGRVLYEDIIAMYARLLPASFKTARWVVSQSTLPDLLTLSIAIGTGGAAMPLVKETNGQYSMLGIPIIVTEKVPALGTAGDVGLYDFSQYVVGMRSVFTLEKSGHVGFASDTSMYRGLIRVDGQPKVARPITPANGGATLSPFVTLAA